jgi:hypothetical protein
MKKLILAVLAAGTLALGPIQATARGGGYGGGWGFHGGYGFRGGGFGYGLASGFLFGAAVAGPWYYNGYYGPYDGYYGGWPYYNPGYTYYYNTPAPRYQSAPAVTQPSAPAPASQPAPTTVINNYYYNSSPMSGANALFGR